MSTLVAPEKVDMKELAKVSTPKATRSWNPVPHHSLIQLVLDELGNTNFELASDPEIGLSHERARCFFLLNLKSTHSDFCLSIGGRNAHDKEFALALFGGASVYICSNLQAFSQYALKTKHTSNVFDRLPSLICDGLKEIEIDGKVNDERIQYFKDFEIENDSQIHDYVIKSMDSNVITTSLIPKVLEDWRKPRHEEFAPRNMWSFNNCFTEVFKEYKNPEQINSRSINLTKTMDEWTLFDKTEVRARLVPEEIIEVLPENPKPEVIEVTTAPTDNPAVVYEATEDEDDEEVTDDELQEIFAEAKKEDAKPKKEETKKPKAKKGKQGKGLDAILTNLAEERKAKKNPTLLRKRK